MIEIMGHAGLHRRVAINVGAGFVPGMNSVLMGAALAGGKLGWEMVGIRDGFEGLLHPDRYPDGGLVILSPELVENLDPATGGILGQAPEVDPFHAPTAGEEEADLSDELLRRLKAENIDALISVVGDQGLEYPLQAPSQGAPYGMCPPVHRERHCRYRGILWVQHRPQRDHRDAEQGLSGGPVGPEDRGGRGPGRAGRLDRPPGRYRRSCRRRADSRDPLRSEAGGGPAEGQDITSPALWSGRGG